MNSASAPGPIDKVGVIDAIARAAHQWVRHSVLLPSDAESPGYKAFLAGLIGGLCDELYQEEGACQWVAYVYALLDGRRADALRRALEVLAAAGDPGERDAYERGYAEGAAFADWFRSARPGT